MKHLQKYNEFNLGDYVFLLKDELNGNPIKGISKFFFNIDDFQRQRGIIWCLISNNQYRQWVKSTAIRKASGIEIAEIKYNL